MYTSRVLSDMGADDPELRARLFPLKGKESSVQWIQNNINRFSTTNATVDTGTDSLQQSDLLREFYLTIAKHGLHAAFKQEMK